mgnify:CR=1 FL=1
MMTLPAARPEFVIHSTSYLHVHLTCEFRTRIAVHAAEGIISPSKLVICCHVELFSLSYFDTSPPAETAAGEL